MHAAMPAPWPSRGLHYLGKSIEPYDDIASCCGDIVGHFGLIRNEI